MLRVINGARAVDGANNASDIPNLNYAAANTMNSTAVDMSGHMELLVNASTGALTGTATLALTVQESNESGANFTNISGSNMNFAATDDNKSLWQSVDWTHPDRKRYARVQGITANNTVEYGARTLRVRPRHTISTDTGFILT